MSVYSALSSTIKILITIFLEPVAQKQLFKYIIIFALVAFNVFSLLCSLFTGMLTFE